MSGDTTRSITKEIFLDAVVCPTMGWFTARGGGGPPSPSDLFRLQEGREIHERARGLFPEGVFAGSPERTRELLGSHDLIFEVAFETGGYAARADMLRRVPGGYAVVETKSSLFNPGAAKPELIDDLAYTVLVLCRAGVPVCCAELLLLNRDWRLGDPESELFIADDQTEAVEARVAEFDALWEDIRTAVFRAEPPPPELIFDCRACGHFGSCTGRGVEHPIFSLPRLSAKRFNKLKSAGIVSIEGVPVEWDLTAPQRRVAEAVRTGRPVVDPDVIRSGLAQIETPVAYLDFETLKTAIPLWPGVAPQEQIVTQYSLHLDNGRETTHGEYLAAADSDRRRELAERLIEDLRDAASIVVYSPFEKRILSGLAVRFPDLEEPIKSCIDRLVDLEPVVRNGYYHPAFGGRTSLKAVLPVVAPALRYDDLPIGDGDAAMTAFARLARGEVPAAEIQNLRQNLLDYCRVDTLAMVRLHRSLAAVS